MTENTMAKRNKEEKTSNGPKILHRQIAIKIGGPEG